MLDVALVQLEVVSLDGTFQLLLVLFVLLELLRHVLLFLFLPLMELTDAPLVVNMAESAATEVATRLEIVVLLSFWLD